MHSRFREVLLLDADNVPTIDPTFLFDIPEYRETGAIFWPDWATAAADNPAWRVFGVAYRDEREQESGQLVIDKQRRWKPLNLCNWYNEHSDFFYRFVYGDKDTFRFAWHRAGQPFSMPAGPIGLPFTIGQQDFGGRLLFQHRCADKWSLAGNRIAHGFAHEDLCVSFVGELATRWNAVARHLRRLSAADRAQMDARRPAAIDSSSWDGGIGPSVCRLTGALSAAAQSSVFGGVRMDG